MASFWYVCTQLGAFCGGLLLAYSLVSNGAPQQAAGAALAIGMAVIPYVMARACQELASKPPPPND